MHSMSGNASGGVGGRAKHFERQMLSAMPQGRLALPMALSVGAPLPMLPLALRNAGVLPLDLEETYSETRVRSKLV